MLLDFDSGAHRAVGRKDTVRPNTWDEVMNITAADLAPYKTLVMDTAGRAIDLIIANLNAKLKRADGQPTQQGWGQVRSQFTLFLSKMRTAGVDVVLVVHSIETQSGDAIKSRIDVQGSSKNEIHKIADAVAYIYMDGERRSIGWNPTEERFGKNPLGALSAAVIPDVDDNPHYLADCIVRLKEAMVTMSQGQAEESQRVAGLEAAFQAFNSADEFTAHSKTMDGASLADRRLLINVAKSKGLEYDRDGKAFAPITTVDAAPSEPAPEPAADQQAGLQQFLRNVDNEELDAQYAAALFKGSEPTQFIILEEATLRGMVWSDEVQTFVPAETAEEVPEEQEALL